jgi:maleate isomerase
MSSGSVGPAHARAGDLSCPLVPLGPVAMLSPVSFDRVLVDLLEATRASRTTLRLDKSGGAFPVVGEALAPGVRSIRTVTIPSLSAAPTVRFLADRLEILVQRDSVNADLAPPPDLLARYGVRAQMLAPVIGNGQLIGIVSVHHNPGPRDWTDAEVEMLRAATQRIENQLRRKRGTSD